MTIRVEESVLIERSPAVVWDAIADYRLDREWREGLLEMTPNPPGGPAPGTKVHEVVWASQREFVADTVVTELDPGASYSFEGAGTIGGLRGGRAVRADGDGDRSVFTYRIELEPKGAMRMVSAILRPMVRSGLRRDLRKLKAYLEGRPY
jgi:hypothetical protein